MSFAKGAHPWSSSQVDREIRTLAEIFGKLSCQTTILVHCFTTADNVAVTRWYHTHLSKWLNLLPFALAQHNKTSVQTMDKQRWINVIDYPFHRNTISKACQHDVLLKKCLRLCHGSLSGIYSFSAAIWACTKRLALSQCHMTSRIVISFQIHGYNPHWCSQILSLKTYQQLNWKNRLCQSVSMKMTFVSKAICHNYKANRKSGHPISCRSFQKKIRYFMVISAWGTKQSRCFCATRATLYIV